MIDDIGVALDDGPTHRGEGIHFLFSVFARGDGINRLGGETRECEIVRSPLSPSTSSSSPSTVVVPTPKLLIL
jgi:hypothetical protein